MAANGKTDRDCGKKCGRRRAVLLSAFQGSMGQEIGFTGGWKRTIGPVGDQDFSGARTGMIPLEVSLSLASGRRPQATCQFSAKVSSGVMPNSTRYPGDFGRFLFSQRWCTFWERDCGLRAMVPARGEAKKAFDPGAGTSRSSGGVLRPVVRAQRDAPGPAHANAPPLTHARPSCSSQRQPTWPPTGAVRTCSSQRRAR